MPAFLIANCNQPQLFWNRHFENDRQRLWWWRWYIIWICFFKFMKIPRKLTKRIDVSNTLKFQSFSFWILIMHLNFYFVANPWHQNQFKCVAFFCCCCGCFWFNLFNWPFQMQSKGSHWVRVEYVLFCFIYTCLLLLFNCSIKIKSWTNFGVCHTIEYFHYNAVSFQFFCYVVCVCVSVCKNECLSYWFDLT